MNRYSVTGLTTATAATNAVGIATLWNPSTAKSIFIVGIKVYKTIATVDVHALARISVRGTAAATVTPDIDNDYDHGLAPVSGALLDVGAYSGALTALTPSLESIYLPAAIGSGYNIVFPKAIQVKQSAGFGIITGAAVIGQPCNVTFIWDE